MRRTRGGELGRTLGCALGWYLGRERIDYAIAVRRTAGPARWAFGPPGERAARTQQNGAEPLVVLWALLLAELLRPVGSCSSPPPHAADCNSSELVVLTADGAQL